MCCGMMKGINGSKVRDGVTEEKVEETEKGNDLKREKK